MAPKDVAVGEKALKRHPAVKEVGGADPAGSKKKQRVKKSKQSYKMYIYKVLKRVHPDLGVSAKTMSIMNLFIADTFEKIAEEAGRFVRYNKKPTIALLEIQTAVKVLLPGELAKHAVSEGTKAVTKFTTV